MVTESTSIEDLTFELKDIEIFKIPDTKTCIATVQNYFFPRLEILLHHSCDLIREIYGVNPYDRMTFVYCPNNRKNARQNREFYHVHIGLSGKRTHNGLRFLRRDGKPFHFHPTYLTFNIDFDGSIRVELRPFVYYVSKDFITAVADLYRANYSALSPLLGCLQITHQRIADHVEMGDAFNGEHEDVVGNLFYSPRYFFPTDLSRGLWHLMLCFATFYPLLDSLNSLGEGEAPRLAEMLGMLKEWHHSEDGSEESEIENEQTRDGEEQEDNFETLSLPELDSYNFVRPGVWWTVLARDNWTCCSCGRSSKEEGITLEVDHITPRSKGGTNEINNLQTLCKKCNIGKSNRDATDLRRRTIEDVIEGNNDPTMADNPE
jgi:hypothetical protein